jgi:allantoin racemase
MRLRVVTPITTTGFMCAEQIAPLVRPDTELSYVEIEHGPASIECEFDAMLATPDTVARIVAAEQEGVDAVVINCMDDPGLRAAREMVSIPVLGPCETAMHLAAMLAHRFSVVTVLDHLEPQFANQAKVYGVADKLASVRSVSIPVLDLESDEERLVEALATQSARTVEEDGAHAIIFGCTGMLGVAEAVARTLEARGITGVPVLDPLVAALKMAAAIVDLGLTHSKRTYPNPPRKAIRGYEQIAGLLAAGVA